MEVIVAVIIVPALVVGFFALLFGLGRVVSPERVQRIGRGLRTAQYTLWHVMIGVMVTALALHAFVGDTGNERLFSTTLLSLLVLGWFVRVWCNQFVFLMGLGDDDLPGRHDKLIWAFLLFAFAPITVWFFRSYRLAHWPEPVPVRESHQPQHAPENQGTTATQPA
jgi:hypothetical protein